MYTSTVHTRLMAKHEEKLQYAPRAKRVHGCGTQQANGETCKRLFTMFMAKWPKKDTVKVHTTQVNGETCKRLQYSPGLWLNKVSTKS